jgi:ribonuclease inhibitor
VDVRIATVPGDLMTSELDVHRVLAEQLDFGPYYGRNLDALWDRLTTDVERPAHIIWTHAARSRKTLGRKRFNKFAGVLLQAAARDAGKPPAKRLTVDIQDGYRTRLTGWLIPRRRRIPGSG